jgi:hypothetical protein
MVRKGVVEFVIQSNSNFGGSLSLGGKTPRWIIKPNVSNESPRLLNPACHETINNHAPHSDLPIRSRDAEKRYAVCPGPRKTRNNLIALDDLFFDRPMKIGERHSHGTYDILKAR